MFWNTNNEGMETNKKLNAEAGDDAEAVAPGQTAAAQNPNAESLKLMIQKVEL